MSLVADSGPRPAGQAKSAARAEIPAMPVQSLRQSWIIDALVLVSIVVTAGAILIAAKAELGLSLGLAMALGGVSMLAFMCLHMVMRRIELRARVRAAGRHRASHRRLDAAGAGAAKRSSKRTAAKGAARQPEEARPMGASDEAAAEKGPADTMRAAAPDAQPTDNPSEFGAPAAAMPSYELPPAPAAAQAPGMPPASAGPTDEISTGLTADATEQALQDVWAVRPGEAPAPPFSPAPGADAHELKLVPDPGSSQQSDDDAQVIESVLARMAADLGAGQKTRPPAPPAVDATPSAPAQALETTETDEAIARSDAAAEPVAPPPIEASGPASTGAVPRSVDETEATEALAAKSGAAHKLAAIATALAQERIDVFLEPISGLEGQGVRHFEVGVRLRVEGDEALDRIAYSASTSGTPLLPLIDTIAIAKSRRVAWRLFQPDQDGHVFTAVDTGSLVDQQFMLDFQALMRGDTAAPQRLVMSFSQAEVRSLTDGQFAALDRLAGAGFCFAVDHLTDLDMDFARLRDVGFTFVKIDADVFLDGLAVTTSRVPADDICRYLKSVDLQPIVGHIRDQQQLQRLRACGVALGQGPLVGGRHLVKSEWLRDETPPPRSEPQSEPARVAS